MMPPCCRVHRCIFGWKASHEPPLFVGEVTAVDYEYGPARQRVVRVRGYDFLHRLRKRQPVGAHVQLNLNELAQALVADLGLSVEAVDPGPLRQNIIQYNQSDLDLMTQAAERCGLYFTLRDGSPAPDHIRRHRPRLFTWSWAPRCLKPASRSIRIRFAGPWKPPAGTLSG